MKKYLLKTTLLLPLCCVSIIPSFSAAQPNQIPNRFISYPEFLETSNEVDQYRQERRVSENTFKQMSLDKNTIILDTRSKKKFDLLHIKGAKHLNFSDITTSSLKATIPSQDTRILIYCNNNFDNEPRAFPTKLARAALNIPTFITLYSYGYKNLYELGPVQDPSKSILPFEGTLTKQR